MTQIEADIAVAIQPTIIGLVEGSHHGSQRHRAGDATRLTVIDLAGSQAHDSAADEASAVLVFERSGGQPNAVTGNSPFASVIETTCRELKTGVAQHLTTVIDRSSGGSNRSDLRTGNTAAGVVQRCGRHGQRAIAADDALFIVQCTGNVETQAVFAVNPTAAGIGQFTEIQLDGLLPGDHAVGLVVETVCRQQQRAVGHQTAFLAVIELADRCCERTEAGDFRVLVVQGCRVQLEAIGRYHPAQVGQQPVDAKDQRLVAQHRTFGVVQRSGRQRETIRTGNLAAPVTHHIQIFQQQLAGCVDQSILVVQHTVIQIQADITVAVKTTIIGLIKAGDHRRQCHGAGDAARLGVVDLSGSQPKGAGAGKTPVLVVIECARGDGHAVRCNATALTVVQRTAGQRQAGVTEHLSALVDDGCSGGN
ncbi:hypothetical protein PS634_02652 [Pseudomonas fluorescens]|nr:hypothetical protein PS634_02652 [Pseudomonas fluorescens]